MFKKIIYKMFKQNKIIHKTKIINKTKFLIKNAKLKLNNINFK